MEIAAWISEPYLNLEREAQAMLMRD